MTGRGGGNRQVLKRDSARTPFKPGCPKMQGRSDSRKPGSSNGGSYSGERERCDAKGTGRAKIFSPFPGGWTEPPQRFPVPRNKRAKEVNNFPARCPNRHGTQKFFFIPRLKRANLPGNSSGSRCNRGKGCEEEQIPRYKRAETIQRCQGSRYKQKAPFEISAPPGADRQRRGRSLRCDAINREPSPVYRAVHDLFRAI